MSKKRGLGRGLESLLGSAMTPAADAPLAIFPMPVSELVQGTYQPRQSMNDDDLSNLVESVKQQGVLQPILVRELTGSRVAGGLVSHEIVAGERRWRAAKIAGLKTVPVVIRKLDDQAALAVALVENLQRKDLNAMEVAESLQRLTQEFGLTHQEIANTVGRSRSAVSNFLRLLELAGPVREALASGQLEMGHARALLPLDLQQQTRISRKIEAEALSVRQVEQIVSKLLRGSGDSAKKAPTIIETQTRWLQHQFANELGTKVVIRNQKDGNKSMSIDFADLEQLQTSLRKIESLVGQVIDAAGPRARNKSA